MGKKRLDEDRQEGRTTRRELLIKGAKGAALLTYVVPAIDSVLVGIAEAAPEGSRGNPYQGGGRARGRPSCPPGQVLRFDQCFPVPRGNAGSGSGKNDVWK